MTERKSRRRPRGKVREAAPPPPLRGSPSLVQRDLFLAAAVALIAFAAFANSIGNGFVYDDMSAIQLNTRLDFPGRMGTFFTTPYWSDGRGALYRPLTLLTWAWDRAIFGPGPFGVHLVNVLANAVLAVLVFLFLRSLLGNRPLAALAAIFFAVHPVHTEVVANGVGGAEVMSGVFLVLAAWIHVLLAPRAQDAPPGPRGLSPAARRRLGVVPPVAFLIALFFKESAVVLPGLLFLAEWLILGRGKLPRGSRLVGGYLGYIFPLALYLIARTSVVGSKLPEIQEVMAGLDAGGRFLFALATLLAYVGQLVFPLTLCAEYSDYRNPLPSTLTDPRVAAALLAGGAAIVLAVWLYRRRRFVPLFGMAWFALAILPVSNLLFPIGTVRGDRLLFVPSLGFAVILAWGVTRLGARSRPAAVLLTAAVLGFYGWRTVTRNAEWKSQETLWTADVAKNPGTPIGWAFLGDIHRDRGELDEALADYRRSYELRDRKGFYPESHNNAAKILSGRGDVAGAVREYRLVLSRDPRQFTALVNLGEIQLHADSTRAEAIDLLTRAAAVKTDDFIPWANLSQAYWLSGRPDSALAAIDRAIRISPERQDLKETRAEFVKALSGGSPRSGAGTPSPDPR
jgi:tetratricopeptide (TPR) repeat protein